MTFKFCPECGFKFDGEYKFCPECGYKLGGGEKKKKVEPLFDFSEDTAKYADEKFGGLDAQLKKQEEVIKKAEAAQKALEDAQKKAKAEAEKKTKAEAEKKAKEEAAKAEAERKAREEEEKRAQAFKLTKSEQNKKAQAIGFFNVGRNRKALHIFLTLAEKDIDCQYMLGRLYDDSYDVKTDKRKAFYWYKRAAENGHLKAQLAVAESYYKGTRGAGKSERLAKEWYKKAADQGDATAKSMLRSLH